MHFKQRIVQWSAFYFMKKIKNISYLFQEWYNKKIRRDFFKKFIKINDDIIIYY